MSPRKPEPKKATSEPARRKKLALNKETLKDLTDRKGAAKGGARAWPVSVTCETLVCALCKV